MKLEKELFTGYDPKQPIKLIHRIGFLFLSPLVFPIVLMIPLMFLFTFASTLIFKEVPSIGSTTGIVMGISYAISMVVLLFYMQKHKIPLINRKQTGMFGLEKKDWQFLLWYIPVSIVVVQGSHMVLQHFMATPTPANQDAIMGMMSDIPLTVMFFVVVICSPIFEEWIFRGVFLFHKGNIEPKWKTMIITSIAFGLVHGPTDFPSFWVYSLMGLSLAYAVKRTNSIEAAILLHMFNNLLGFIGLMSIA